MPVAQVMLVALHLIVLHRSDGGDVTINADQITSLRDPVRHGQLFPAGHCIIGLTDGKFVAVLEACAEVRRLLE